LQGVEVTAYAHLETDPNGYLFGMAKRIANAGAETGVVTPAECVKWRRQLAQTAESGDWFLSITYLGAAASNHPADAPVSFRHVA
jgi:hypothetical protein